MEHIDIDDFISSGDLAGALKYLKSRPGQSDRFRKSVHDLDFRLKTVEEKFHKHQITDQDIIVAKARLGAELLQFVEEYNENAVRKPARKKKLRKLMKSAAIFVVLGAVAAFLIYLMIPYTPPQREKPDASPNVNPIQIVILRFDQLCDGYRDVGLAIHQGLENLKNAEKLPIQSVYLESVKSAGIQKNALDSILREQKADIILYGAYKIGEACAPAYREEYCINYQINDLSFYAFPQDTVFSGNEGKKPYRYLPGSINQFLTGEFTGNVNYTVDYLSACAYFKSRKFNLAVQKIESLHEKYGIKERKHWAPALDAAMAMRNNETYLRLLQKTKIQAEQNKDTVLLADYHIYQGRYFDESYKKPEAKKEFETALQLLEKGSYSTSVHVLNAYLQLMDFLVKNQKNLEASKLVADFAAKYYKNNTLDLEIDKLTGLKFFSTLTLFYIKTQSYDFAKSLFETSCNYYASKFTYKELENADFQALSNFYKAGKNLYFVLGDQKNCRWYWKKYLEVLNRNRSRLDYFYHHRALMVYGQYLMLQGDFDKAQNAFTNIYRLYGESLDKSDYFAFRLNLYEHLAYSSKKIWDFKAAGYYADKFQEVIKSGKVPAMMMIFNEAAAGIGSVRIPLKTSLWTSARAAMFKGEKEYKDWFEDVYLES